MPFVFGVTVRSEAILFEGQIEVEYLKKDIVWECTEGDPWVPWVYLVCTTQLSNHPLARPVTTHIDVLLLTTASVDVHHAFRSLTCSQLALAMRGGTDIWL